MDFQWVAIALGDVLWISIAFVLGILSRSIGLPPLVGFLITGFLLNIFGYEGGEILQKLADLGITLLLFTVGLKLNLRTLARPQVWGVTGLHMSIVVVVFGFGIYALALTGLPFISDLDLPKALLIAFALSFSSTVLVVKTLEERGEMSSLQGRIAVGILIMQDIAAVAFLAISTGKWPSVWAFLILLLIPMRPLLHKLLQRVGHGELLVLYGFLLALGGAELFEIAQLKGDLGALVLGLLFASHAKADELAKTMLGFKDLFLLGFFLTIGLSGQPTMEAIVFGVVLTPFVFFKSALFFGLFTKFKLRARTALLASLKLSNYSEFGLIVAAIGVLQGWIDNQWLIAIAISLSLTFALGAILNSFTLQIYRRYRDVWKRFQRDDLIPDEQILDSKGATIAIIGMGRVGSGAYDAMLKQHGETIVGVDIDHFTAKQQTAAGRNVLHGDPSDADFWERMQAAQSLNLVLLTLPKLRTNLAVLNHLKATSFNGHVAATARFDDDEQELKEAGATTVFNIYTEAGTGFATHVAAHEKLP